MFTSVPKETFFKLTVTFISPGRFGSSNLSVQRMRDPGADAYDLQQRTRAIRRLRERAATLGFELVNRETGEVLSPAVSSS